MRSPLMLVVCLCSLFASCSSSSRDIKARDSDAFMPTFRTVVDFRDRTHERNERLMQLELDVSGVDGEHERGGVDVGEYRMVEGGASFRFGRKFRDRIRFVGIAGLGWNRLDLEDRVGVPAIDDAETEAGVRLGGELRVQLNNWLGLHARLMRFSRPFDLQTLQTEAGIVLGSPDDFGVIVGYKQWRLHDESSSLQGVDDLDLRTEGLFIGMELRF